LQQENDWMDALSVNAVLGPKGLVSRRIAAYEHRSQQLEMAAAVADALNDQKHLVVEAGTGVGKSYAYLVPAILHATSNEGKLSPGKPASPKPAEAKNAEAKNAVDKKISSSPASEDDDDKVRRIVISTHTISLQEQLMAKDIPLLNSVIPREFSAVLVKGRGNYISLRRMQLAKSRAVSLFGNEADYSQLKQIVDWAEATDDGTRSTMQFKPTMPVWDEVASDSGNCLGRKCPTYDKCFYYKARRRVHNAQILIVNHALFFTDLALRDAGASILPNYDAVILDECHTIEAVASDHLGLSVSSSQIDYTLRKLYNSSTGKGLLVALDLRQVQELCHKCNQRLDEMIHDFVQWYDGKPKHNGRVHDKEIVENILSDKLMELAKQLERYGKDHDTASVKQDLLSASNRLTTLATSLEAWLKQTQEDAVYWLEKTTNRMGSKIILRCSPIDVGPTLRKMLFQKVPSVIMTSATLASGRNGGFEFFQSRIGATGSRTKQLGSPFNYRKQAELILLTDLPDPSSERLKFENMLPSIIQHYAGLTEGHAFVLFTSYDLLRRMVDRLTPWMSRMNLAIYSQADGTPRGQLLDAFKKHPQGILFGTDSFWQGVDVPGDALRNVIITKLPFSVPDSPLLEGRLEAIRNRGGNPFRDYQLPEAIIKLRQGFGRLIRTATDSGMVVIADPRITTKPYGRTFLDSLPECSVSNVSGKRWANELT
jgi:ATP-dependent DNA helicase DinG